MLEVLIKHGANVKQKTVDGEDVITFAQRAPIAQLLLENGADINARCPYSGKNLLLKAMNINYDADLIKLYLEKGLSPFQCDRMGNSALHQLVWHSSGDNQIQKLDYLIDNLSSQDVIKLFGHTNNEGKTALEAAVSSFQKTGVLNQADEANFINQLMIKLCKARKNK